MSVTGASTRPVRLRPGLGDSQFRGRRGVGGGYMLARSSDKINLLEIINTVGQLQRIETCPLKIRSHGTRLCPLHRRVDEATATLIEYFRGVTLAQIVAEKSGSIPLCADSGPTLVQLR